MNDKVKNISLYYFKRGKQVKQHTLRRFGRKIYRLVRLLNFKKWSKVEIVVRYQVGYNSMTLMNKSDAEWCINAFIKEYGA